MFWRTFVENLRLKVIKGELHLKIVNTFFWKIIYASYSKLSKGLKNRIKT